MKTVYDVYVKDPVTGESFLAYRVETIQEASLLAEFAHATNRGATISIDQITWGEELEDTYD